MTIAFHMLAASIVGLLAHVAYGSIPVAFLFAIGTSAMVVYLMRL